MIHIRMQLSIPVVSMLTVC